MIKSILYFLMFMSICLSTSYGQTDIRIDVKHYDSDTLIFGYYMAERMLGYDTLYREKGAAFHVSADSSLTPGMYIVVSVPQGLFYQVLLGAEDQEFGVTIDTLSQNEITFDGSVENDIFYSYLSYINQARQEIQRIDNVLTDMDSTLISVRDQLEKDKLTINDMVLQRQNEVLSKYPQSIAAILIKANMPFEFPEWDGTPEEIEHQKFLYYKEHYFDKIDLKHPAILRTPIVHERINYYEESLTYKEPDSLIKSIDYLLGMMDEGSEIYRYYLSYFLNKYANSKYIGMDAVYVHLALEYYGKGKASWVSEENLKEIVGNARKMAPVLINKKAPEFHVTKEDGTPIVLSELQNQYTVVVFWKPSCGHCTKAMPHIIEFQEKYRDKGVEVVAICTERGKKVQDCWQGVKDKHMENLINGVDEFGQDRTVARYYAVNTPMIYVIDKDKVIKIKKIPAENLGAVMDQIMTTEEEVK